MKYRSLDENGDYVLGRRDHFLSGREAVAQAIKTRILLLLGEWWENVEDGLPLFEKILATFQGNEGLVGVDLTLSERIVGTQGVLRILQFDSSLNPSTRVYSASCVVDTEYGLVELTIGGRGAENSVKTRIKEVFI